MREYLLDGIIPLKVKNDKDCIFCKHCTDCLYDSHGIYCFICELERDECNPYKEDGTHRTSDEHTCEMFTE